MVKLLTRPPREQASLATQPYDCWMSVGGGINAEFHRIAGGHLLRFPGEADFEVFPNRGECGEVIGWPTLECAPDHFQSIFSNSIVPLIGNHRTGLFLHGSAVVVDGRAIAFIGESRSGKTTLAGAFARAGDPFLTEDVIELISADGKYWLQPKPSGLRVFADSAEFLLGTRPDWLNSDAKGDVSSPEFLPFADQPAPLAALFVMGDDHAAPLRLTPLNPRECVQSLLPHSFVLDVEDKSRLRAHFSRIVALSLEARSFIIDYPREYSQLSHVVETVRGAVEGTI